MKTAALMRNGKFDSPAGTYSVSDIQDYFEYIIKTHETVTDNSLIRIYVNKIENRSTFTIKTRYYLKFLTSELTKLLGRTENEITKDKNEENVLHLEIINISLLQYCQQ